jgi:hypothetical protein
MGGLDRLRFRCSTANVRPYQYKFVVWAGRVSVAAPSSERCIGPERMHAKGPIGNLRHAQMDRDTGQGQRFLP